MSQTYEETVERRDVLLRRVAGKAGLRAKIDAKCIECIYDPTSEGNWRKQVHFCTDTACPLFSVRPKSRVLP